MEVRYQRQANTSPISNKPRVHEYNNKNTSAKGAFKRNLFGEPSGDQSPALAKQLNESPLKVYKSNQLKESTNQTVKRSDNGNNKTSTGGREKKGK